MNAKLNKSTNSLSLLLAFLAVSGICFEANASISAGGRKVDKAETPASVNIFKSHSVEALNCEGEREVHCKMVSNFIAEVVEGDTYQHLLPERWSDTLSSQYIDLKKVLNFDFEAGTAFAAVASQELNIPFENLSKAMGRPDILKSLLENIKTLKDLDILTEIKNPLVLKMKIDVPVINDFSVEEVVRHYEKLDPAKKSKTYVIEWHQNSDFGEMSYNHGATVAKQYKDKVRVFVVGVFILKNDHKMSWITRGAAKNFAKSHYASYIDAVNAVITIDQKTPSL
ncbi:MAG: hypothetical protein COT74_09060 [Bdellovibrionales bacterium CG10_big_fil_rev_8_21_14_0_10_45_34]|nr:MAG: hypothetical protein COT74_09060 [Bdellovibrionales bacterium CG10_big_fil_rev_8_21_14_0_10_45_34]